MKEQLWQDVEDASIIQIYEQKVNRQACDNHCGISLLYITGKILGTVFLNHLNNHLQHGILPERQCGFCRELGTVDMVFAIRPLQAKCQEQNTYLYSAYVDLTKVFETISTDCLWRIRAKYGCPEKFVRQFHDDMHGRVQDNGESSVAFPVTNEVKHGYVLTRTLFRIMFSAMLFDAFNGSDSGIDIRYRTDGSVFNLKRLQVMNKLKTDIVNELLFANDCALDATTKANLKTVFTISQ